MSGHEDELRREQERKEQRERSKRGKESNDRGRWFHRGMAEFRGETRENGWQHEYRHTLESGREVRFDTTLHTNELGGRDFTEYKSGKEVGGPFVLEQVSKGREVLATDPNARGAYVMIEGTADGATHRELDALTHEFPARFHVVEVTQQQAERAMRLGQELERDRNQLELINSSKLRNQERARERTERGQQKQRTREAAERALEKQEHERKIREAQQQQREAAERIATMAREDREAAQRGEKPPMTGREAADILAISRPTPGTESTHRQPPGVSRAGHDAPGRERDHGRER